MDPEQRDPIEIAAGADDEGDLDPLIHDEERLALGDDEIELVTHYLRLGRRLPPALLPRLFEVPKEYRLSYAGKLREADVLADTMAVPLQPQRVFGDIEVASHNALVMGDNLQVLKQLVERKRWGQLRNADGTDGVRLVYIDPPFATGEAWETRSGRVAYSDKVRGAEFIEWLRRRLILLKHLMSDDGSIVVHLDQRYVHYIKVIMDEIFPGNFRNEIVVPRGIKGVQSQFDTIDALAQGHYTLLLYSRRASTKYRKLFDQGTKPSRWDTFWLGTDRRTMRYPLFGVTPQSGQWRWSEAKAKAAIENYEQYLEEGHGLSIEDYAALVKERTGNRPDFLRRGEKGPQWYRYAQTKRLASDVWQIKSKGSKTDYPTEKHEDLLERVIAWLTREGDIVLDAFVGSGTTVTVAESLNRRWVGVDAGKYSIYTTQTRLLRQAREAGYTASFTTYNAGLYDYAMLRKLPRREYLSFALQLFQCRHSEEIIGGVTFQGLLGDHRVLVFDYQSHGEGKIGHEFVQDIAELCADKLGERCFIIAPAAAVEPYEDYLDVQGVRFYFLRIPYSVIAELHKRGFTELRQPSSVKGANQIVDAVGFDFIQPPSVVTDHAWTDGEMAVSITGFESEAFSADGTAGHGDLAMVLVDDAFDGDVFMPSHVYFAEDLEKSDWTFTVRAQSETQRVAITYLDIYGNEYREAVDPPRRRRQRSRKKEGQ